MNSIEIMRSGTFGLLANGILLLPSIIFVEDSHAVTTASQIFTSGSAVTTATNSNQQLRPMLISARPGWQSKLPRVQGVIVSELEGFLKQYAQGNEGSAGVEALEVRGAKVYMRAVIRHRQVTTFRLLGKTRKVVTYSLTNTVETTFDPLNPTATLDRSRLCANLAPMLGGGKVCVSAGDVVRIIATGLP